MHVLLFRYGEANSQETTATEKIVCNSQFPREGGGWEHGQALVGRCGGVSQAAEGDGGKYGQEPLFWFL